MDDKEKAINLSVKLKKLKKRRDKIENQIREMAQELTECCPHDKVIIKESYISGSYLDKEEYITSTYCELCETLVDRKIKYGGFG